MAKRKQPKEGKTPSEGKRSDGSRPKGPIGKDDMAKALCTDATYDFLDQWEKDIYFYAEGSDVTDTIRGINEKVEEDIFYTKLFVMEFLTANAKIIEEDLFRKMVELFLENFPTMRVASAHFNNLERLGLDPITTGLFYQLNKAKRNPEALIRKLLETIPKEEWERLSSAYGKETSTIPLLVAMKAVEENISGSEWAFLQGLKTGHIRRFFRDDEDLKWDFKYCFNKVLDRNNGYDDVIAGYVPYLVSLEHTVADPAVKDDVLFWLTSRFGDFITGQRSMNETLVKDLFNAMLIISKDLKPGSKIADRFPAKMWDTLAESMKSPVLTPELRSFFAQIMQDDKGTQSRTSTTLEKEVEEILGQLRSSTAPNERFFAVDRLRSILSVNLIPIAPRIRETAFEAVISELDKETDRLVCNGLISLVFEAGSPKDMKALRAVLQKHLEDASWKDLSNSQVDPGPYGELPYIEITPRTFALEGIIAMKMEDQPDEGLEAMVKGLVKDKDQRMRSLCYNHLLSETEGDEFCTTFLELMEDDLPYRVILHQKLRPLFLPNPLEFGVEFIVKEKEVERLVSFLKKRYKDESEEKQARIRRILIQEPSLDIKDLLNKEYHRRDTDPEWALTDLWLQLGYLSGLGPKVEELFVDGSEDFIRAYTQIRLEAVLEDPEVASRLAVVDVFKVMKALGLKLRPMKLVDAVLNERLSFEAVVPALEVLQEGDWDIFLNETVNLFNVQLDGIEHRLELILSKFCNYIREKHTKWYEGRWHSILLQMVMNRSTGGAFMGFWTEKDQELALMWVKEDAESTNWSTYIAILWNISDESYRIKKVVPAILKNWREDALWALGELDRLDQPLDVISTDKALAVLYEKVWEKFPDSRKALIERWFSTEHFTWAYHKLQKAKGDEKEQLQDIVKTGLEGLGNRLASRCRDGIMDQTKPFEGSGPLVEVLEEVVDKEPVDASGVCTLAMFCLMAGGWVPFLGKVDTFIDKNLTAKEKGIPGAVAEVYFTYSDDSNDYSFPALLLKAIEQGHMEALTSLMRLMDSGLAVGMEPWAGNDGRFERLTDLIAGASLGPIDVAKALEGHQEIQMAYLLKFRTASSKVPLGGKRPRPSDFGMAPIEYDL